MLLRPPTSGAAIGTDTVQVTSRLSIEIPRRFYLDSEGKRLEGVPFEPRHFGSGDVKDALFACGY